MHASLCGGDYLLKALGSVASYLADRLFNLSNDSLCHRRQRQVETEGDVQVLNCVLLSGNVLAHHGSNVSLAPW